MNNPSVSSSKSSARRRQFEDCLFENLLKVPYNDVSVSELCQQVGVSRRAFYRHFRDKDECLGGIFHRSFQACLLHIAENSSQQSSPLESAAAMMTYWKEQRILTELILKNNLFPLYIAELVRFIKEEERQLLVFLNTPEMDADDDILICHLTGQLAMAFQWHRRGYDTPEEDMARKYVRLVYRPMFGAADMKWPAP